MSIFEKKQWTGTEHQTPTPKIEVFLPSNTSSSEPDYTFLPDIGAGAWSKLLNYSFTESVEDLDGSFSFTTENGIIGEGQNGQSVFDIILKRSVIKIYEGGNLPAFIGIIRRRRISKQKTSQGIKRTIIFSGKSIISCIVEYTVSLDVKIQGVADAISKQKELTIKLSEAKTIKEFMIIAWKYYQEISESAGISTTGLAEIINRHIGNGDPETFIDVKGSEQNLRYNIACILFNAGNNVIADVWRNILPKNAYEIFCQCENGEPKIVARQVPFGDPENDYEDWKNLDLYVISPVSLTGYDLDQNDENVYTAFASYIIGSPMSREFYMAVNQTGNDSTVAYNDEKMRIYGYKPMLITFNGYNRQGNTDGEKTDATTKAVQKLNELASYWYSRNDDMYSGIITTCTDFRNPEMNPRIGCRAKFLGGEFYIKKTDHAWTYGGTPTIKLSVSRGMMYDENGKMRDGEDGIIKGVGRQFRELERDAAIGATA
ncbi:MAG: hypothetical protein LBQ89_08255 [Treponema sp.]|nr:hypothetical protein [Treponema sp.]